MCKDKFIKATNPITSKSPRRTTQDETCLYLYETFLVHCHQVFMIVCK